MKKTVYFVVNEGEVVYASLSQEKAEAYALEQSQSDLEETVEESGRDIEDLTIEELDELRFQSGFDGGYYYTGSVEYDDESNENETFETEEGDVIYFDDLEECLDRDEDDDFWDDGECFEGDEDDFEEDENDFEDNDDDIFDAEWNDDDDEE